jgi:hypothetical protein
MMIVKRIDQMIIDFCAMRKIIAINCSSWMDQEMGELRN